LFRDATQMRSTVKRLALLGALGTTLGVVAPAASASAAGTPVAPEELAASPYQGSPGIGLPSFGADFVPFLPDGAAASGQVVVGPAVVGTVILTDAPIWVVNANNQNSMGVNVAGVQVVTP
jgi:hypothetical protein